MEFYISWGKVNFYETLICLFDIFQNKSNQGEKSMAVYYPDVRDSMVSGSTLSCENN